MSGPTSAIGVKVNASGHALTQRKRDHAVQLRLLGDTYQAIADARLPCAEHRVTHLRGEPSCPLCIPLYANRSSARKAVLAGLADDHSAAAGQRDELRSQMLGQIDMVVRRQIADALSADLPTRAAAARTLVRLWDRKARLLGLDAPTRVQVTTELDAELETLAAALAGGDGDDAVSALAASLGHD